MYFLGEEDYTALFAIRAKLYRFDTNLKQWKEKGIGEMKVLQHKGDSGMLYLSFGQATVCQYANPAIGPAYNERNIAKYDVVPVLALTKYYVNLNIV